MVRFESLTAIGLIGMPGAGKRRVSELLAERGFEILELSSVVKNELLQQGHEVNPESVIETGKLLRVAEGDQAIAFRALQWLDDAGVPRVVLDGIRSQPEVNLFRQELGDAILFVFLHAPTELRHAAIRSRRALAKSYDDIYALDAEAIRLGILTALLEADAVIDLGPYAQSLESQVERLVGDVGRRRTAADGN